MQIDEISKYLMNSSVNGVNSNNTSKAGGVEKVNFDSYYNSYTNTLPDNLKIGENLSYKDYLGLMNRNAGNVKNSLDGDNESNPMDVVWDSYSQMLSLQADLIGGGNSSSQVNLLSNRNEAQSIQKLTDAINKLNELMEENKNE